MRPRRRWEDDINDFLKLEENETENSIESNNQLNKSWINAAKDGGRWTPARYVNGVRLSDDEVANIT